MECSKKYLYLRKTEGDKHLFAFVPKRCKSWSCVNCRPIKANIVKNYISENFIREELFLVTFTYFHRGDVSECWKDVGTSWNRLRTYVVKKYGKFKYLRVIEPHKNGSWPHVHVLTNKNIMHDDIVKKITDWGFGWNMHSSRVNLQLAMDYISKYLTKPWPSDLDDMQRKLSKTRIVSVSRDMPAIFTRKSEWTCIEYSAPSEHAAFSCNILIDELHKRGASFVIVRPFSEGFVIVSSLEIPTEVLDKVDPPYIWEYSKDYRYSYFPYGLQIELDLNRGWGKSGYFR